jgi:octopine/nopaline transport system permease protein
MLDFSIMADVFPSMIRSLGVTGKLALLILLLGMVLALPLAFARNSKARWLSLPANTYILVIRGVPSLLQVFLVYYGLGQLETVRNSFLWPALRDPFFCVIIALGLNSAAYTAEIVSGALRLVPKGLVEAAHSIGCPGPRLSFLSLYRSHFGQRCQPMRMRLFLLSRRHRSRAPSRFWT